MIHLLIPYCVCARHWASFHIYSWFACTCFSIWEPRKISLQLVASFSPCEWMWGFSGSEMCTGRKRGGPTPRRNPWLPIPPTQELSGPWTSMELPTENKLNRPQTRRYSFLFFSITHRLSTSNGIRLKSSPQRAPVLEDSSRSRAARLLSSGWVIRFDASALFGGWPVNGFPDNKTYYFSFLSELWAKWDLSSTTGDQTRAHCIGSTESQPLDHQEVPKLTSMSPK